MTISDDQKTSRTLLGRLRDWSDAAAWAEGVRIYRPMIERWAAGSGLDPEAVDEVTQRVLSKLAGRMRTFRYDPSASFRGWLRATVRTTAIDYLRGRRRACRFIESLPGLDDRPADEPEAGGDFPDPLRERALRIHEEVRERFGPRQWEVFRRVDIEGESTVEAARAAGLGVRAAYQALYRIRRRLAEAGRLDDQPGGDARGPGDGEVTRDDALPR